MPSDSPSAIGAATSEGPRSKVHGLELPIGCCGWAANSLALRASSQYELDVPLEAVSVNVTQRAN